MGLRKLAASQLGTGQGNKLGWPEAGDINSYPGPGAVSEKPCEWRPRSQVSGLRSVATLPRDRMWSQLAHQRVGGHF